MAFCNKCGANIPEGAGFCPECGNPSVQAGVSEQNYYNEPVSCPEAQDVPESEKKKIFGMGIAAVICGWFPVASIAGIILGSIGRKAFDRIYRSGVKVSAQTRVGGILAKVGKVAGIVMTIVWALIFILNLFA